MDREDYFDKEIARIEADTSTAAQSKINEVRINSLASSVETLANIADEIRTQLTRRARFIITLAIVFAIQGMIFGIILIRINYSIRESDRRTCTRIEDALGQIEAVQPPVVLDCRKNP